MAPYLPHRLNSPPSPSRRHRLARLVTSRCCAERGPMCCRPLPVSSEAPGHWWNRTPRSARSMARSSLSPSRRRDWPEPLAGPTTRRTLGRPFTRQRESTARSMRLPETEPRAMALQERPLRAPRAGRALSQTQKRRAARQRPQVSRRRPLRLTSHGAWLLLLPPFHPRHLPAHPCRLAALPALPRTPLRQHLHLRLPRGQPNRHRRPSRKRHRHHVLRRLRRPMLQPRRRPNHGRLPPPKRNLQPATIPTRTTTGVHPATRTRLRSRKSRQWIGRLPGSNAPSPQHPATKDQATPRPPARHQPPHSQSPPVQRPPWPVLSRPAATPPATTPPPIPGRVPWSRPPACGWLARPPT